MLPLWAKTFTVGQARTPIAWRSHDAREPDEFERATSGLGARTGVAPANHLSAEMPNRGDSACSREISMADWTAQTVLLIKTWRRGCLISAGETIRESSESGTFKIIGTKIVRTEIVQGIFPLPTRGNRSIRYLRLSLGAFRASNDVNGNSTQDYSGLLRTTRLRPSGIGVPEWRTSTSEDRARILSRWAVGPLFLPVFGRHFRRRLQRL